MPKRGSLIVFALAVFFSTCAAAAHLKHASVPTKPLQIFEFMGSNTEESSNMSQVDSSTCSKTDNKISCTNYNNPTLAGHPMHWLTQDFYNGKIYHVYGDFGEYAYGDLLTAFTAKYGPPDHTETRKWESKAGGVFDNTVTIWRFKGGNLELDSMGLQVDSGSFEFTSSANAPPAAAPKIDF